MVTPPAATIVITTKDRPALLRRAIDSALAQSLPDVEVVVVDDGSSPPVTLDLIDERVTLVRNEAALGACAARNVGVRIATAPFVTFLDDDDELAPGMIEASLQAIAESTLPGPVASLVSLERVDEEGHVVSARTSMSCRRGEFEFMRHRADTTIIGNGLVVPTHVFREIGGWDPDLPMHDDLFFRLLPQCSIQATEFVGYRMTMHPGVRMTAGKARMAEWFERTEEKHRELMRAFPRERAMYLSNAGSHYYWAGQWGKGVRTSWRAIRVDFRAPHVLRRFLRSLAGPHGRELYHRVHAVPLPKG